MPACDGGIGKRTGGGVWLVVGSDGGDLLWELDDWIDVGL